jgi:hypothetical protein
MDDFEQRYPFAFIFGRECELLPQDKQIHRKNVKFLLKTLSWVLDDHNYDQPKKMRREFRHMVAEFYNHGLPLDEAIISAASVVSAGNLREFLQEEDNEWKVSFFGDLTEESLELDDEFSVDEDDEIEEN